MKNSNISNADEYQISNRCFDDKMDAQRVILVGGGNVSITADTSNIGKEIFESLKSLELKPIVLKELQIQEVPVIIKEIEKVEVPVIIKEIQIVEKQIVVKETIYKEINIPTIIPKIEVIRIEVPVIIEKIIEKVTIPTWAKIVMTGKAVLIIGFLIKHFNF